MSAKRDAPGAAERFFRKALRAPHTQAPRIISVDKNAAYPPAIEDLKADAELPETTRRGRDAWEPRLFRARGKATRATTGRLGYFNHDEDL